MANRPERIDLQASVANVAKQAAGRRLALTWSAGAKLNFVGVQSLTLSGDEATTGHWVIGFEFDGPVSDGPKLGIRAVLAHRTDGPVTATALRRLPYGKVETELRAQLDDRNEQADAEVLDGLLEPWRSRGVRTKGDYAKLAQAYEYALGRGYRNVLAVMGEHAGASARVMSNRITTARKAGYLTEAAHGKAQGTATAKAVEDMFSDERLEG